VAVFTSSLISGKSTSCGHEDTQKKCFYCGSEPLRFFKKGRSEGFYYNGLDRVNNNLGYVKSNIVPCCFSCNASKMNLDQGAFINRIKVCHDFMQKTGRL
jgi:hypothetical protein